MLWSDLQLATARTDATSYGFTVRIDMRGLEARFSRTHMYIHNPDNTDPQVTALLIGRHTSDPTF